MDLIPTEGQSKALDLAARVKKSTGTVIGIINGFAGTGKTTLLKRIVEDIGDCVLLAPTGRAARRISELTEMEAQTIHSWLYEPYEDEVTWEVKFVRKELSAVKRPASGVVVVDECSMVNEDHFEDLIDVCTALGLSLLFVGDEFQLPPVQSGFSIFTAGVGEMVRMTEVLRQALDSPVLRAATMLREGDPYGGMKLLPSIPTQAVIESVPAQGEGLVICYSNKLRHNLNRRIRLHHGLEGDVKPTEPVVVNRNTPVLGWLNGDIMPFGNIVIEPTPQTYDYMGEKYSVNFFGAEMDGRKVVLCKEDLTGELPAGVTEWSLTRPAAWWAIANKFTRKVPSKRSPEQQITIPQPFVNANLGWAMTCHKAQGSQWKDILVLLDKNMSLDSYENKRWLYTALTRAEKNVVYCEVGKKPIF